MKNIHNFDAYVEGGGLNLPHSVKSEEAVLGTLLLDSDTFYLVDDRLTPDYFEVKRNRELYILIREQILANKPAEIVFIEQLIEDRGLGYLFPDLSYVSSLTLHSAIGNIEPHIEILVNKAMRRQLFRICQKTASEAMDESTNVYEIRDQAEQEFASLDIITRNEALFVGDLIEERICALEERIKSGELQGITSGITDLDRITGGFKNGDLIIIAARTSMGKTAFALNSAMNAFKSNDKAIVIFSLEMSRESLMDRLISFESKVNIKKRHLTSIEIESVHKSKDRLERKKILIDDTQELTLNQLKSRARRYARNHNLGMLIVDYLQLVNVTGERSREREVARISAGLKSLAKELKIPVIALSQLSRQVEQRDGLKIPLLSDIRESGSVEQDADVVIFLYRPEYYGILEDKQKNSTKGLAEIIVSKHRNGPTGLARSHFDQEIGEFRDFIPKASLARDG